MEELTLEQKNQLIYEHARLAAQFAHGNRAAVKRLREIEETLKLSPVEIARLAADAYLKEY